MELSILNFHLLMPVMDVEEERSQALFIHRQLLPDPV